MAEDRDYGTDALDDDEASRLLRKILSPAEAQSLVLAATRPCSTERTGRIDSVNRQPGKPTLAGDPVARPGAR